MLRPIAFALLVGVISRALFDQVDNDWLKFMVGWAGGVAGVFVFNHFGEDCGRQR